ncbi:MAG: hypothetical protein HKN03_10240 [Acidimicrobiales bacterium]|nr:hypothetical protein [Acidimicrobiales bacterium]
MTVGSDKLRLLRRIPLVQFDEEVRGYSKSQVDRVLETLAPLADEIEGLQAMLDDANQRADRASAAGSASVAPADERRPDDNFDETLRNTLLLAQRTADQTVREAEARAEELRRDSTAKADSIKASARTEAKELKGEAHAQREQMLADAESERAQLLAEALEHAESRKQAIEEELLSEQGLKRNELLSEIGELERIRDDLTADVARFETFLNARREGVRAGLAEISAVLDDPELLAETETPDPEEIGLLEPEELTEMSVDSYSIATLETEVEAAQFHAAEMATIPREETRLEASDDFDEELPGTALDSDADFAQLDDVADIDASVDQSVGFGDSEVTDSEADTDADDGFGPVDEADVPVASYNDPRPPATNFASDQESIHEMSTPPPPHDPFATAGFEAPTPDPDFGGEPHVPLAASVTQDSVFSSVPETSDPSAYNGLSHGSDVSDPAGLGIGVESPFTEEAEPERPGMSGLAEQARSRLASRVSRLRDNAVPEAEEPDAIPTFAAEDTTAEQAGFPDEAALSAQPPAPMYEPPSFEAPLDAPAFEPEQFEPEQFEPEQFDQFQPPPPEASSPHVANGPLVGNDALPPPPGFESAEAQEWERRDSRPLHPDARIEDLPPDDPFLDELRQMTGGEQPGEDETLNRFLNEEPEKDNQGGWFNRRR